MVIVEHRFFKWGVWRLMYSWASKHFATFSYVGHVASSCQAVSGDATQSRHANADGEVGSQHTDRRISKTKFAHYSANALDSVYHSLDMQQTLEMHF